MLGFRTKGDLRLTESSVARVFNWSEVRQAIGHGISLAKPIQIHLMRHGETETNAKGLVTGSQDVPLTPVGVEEARRIGCRLERYASIVADAFPSAQE